MRNQNLDNIRSVESIKITYPTWHEILQCVKFRICHRHMQFAFNDFFYQILNPAHFFMMRLWMKFLRKLELRDFNLKWAFYIFWTEPAVICKPHCSKFPKPVHCFQSPLSMLFRLNWDSLFFLNIIMSVIFHWDLVSTDFDLSKKY